MGVCLREDGYTRGYAPVPTNIYDIPERIKALDARFFVMRNLRTHLYEVHVAGQRGDTLGCVLPYATLDARAVEYVRKHMAARTEELAREVEKHNARLEASADRAGRDRANYKMTEALRYLDHHESAETLPQELIDE